MNTSPIEPGVTSTLPDVDTYISRIASMLHCEVSPDNSTRMVEKTRRETKAMSILYDLPGRLSTSQERPAPVASSAQSKMMAVERILEKHLNTSLPNLHSIAKAVSLSESTLKRNFKRAYSTSIYEYYLQKKMQLARQMLETDHKAIKEVAYILGYEKPSNFIKMFKKHYDFPPGVFRKRFRD